MVRRGLPEEDLKNLRNSMAEWSSSELLPHGWRFKKVNAACVFKSNKGDWLRGGLLAMKMMERKDNYNQEDIDKISKFLAKN